MFSAKTGNQPNFFSQRTQNFRFAAEFSSPCKDTGIRPSYFPQRLSQRSPGKKVTVAKRVQRTHEGNIHISCEPDVLITVVKNKEIRPEFSVRIQPRSVPLICNNNGHPVKSFRQKTGFVSGQKGIDHYLFPIGYLQDFLAVSAAIASREYGNLPSFLHRPFSQHGHRGRFSGTAGRQVSQTYNKTGKPPDFQRTCIISP